MGRSSLAALYALTAYAAFELGIGFLLSWYYTRVEPHHITSLFDFPDLLLTIVMYLVIVPVFWALYVPEPPRIVRVIDGLIATGALGRGAQERDHIRRFVGKQIAFCNRFWPLLLVAVAIPVIGAVLELPTIDKPGVDRYLFNHSTDHWWHVNTPYFVAWNVMLYVNYYILTCLLIQRICAIVIINRTLERFPPEAQLFHPDRANGFGPIGTYIVRSAPVLGMFGSLLLLLGIYPGFVQGVVSPGYDIGALSAVYGVVIPTFLVWPAWRTHTVMRRLKAQSVGAAGRRVRLALDLANRDPDFSPTEVVERRPGDARLGLSETATLRAWTRALIDRYQIISSEHRTWPFRRVEVSGYIFTTALPLVVATISAYLQLLSLPRK
jgi:hypothetical protein